MAGPDLVIARSAEAVTAVLVDEALFAGFGSLVVLATLELLIRVPA